ncbi:MAG: hypothetical protein HQK85_11315, partial [Nitrospinae bacterium]|nr:hypothetical protein [Nitrospinota bacterium]
MEEKKESVKSDEQICSHCGGILRYYLGSWSCMMCRRDAGHECRNCAHPRHELK